MQVLRSLWQSYRVLTPIIVLALAVAGYGIYWTVLKGQILAGLDQWAADERARGAEIAFDSPQVTGFPYRLQLALSNINYHDPAHPNLLRWQGEAMTFHVLPFSFNHIIAQLEGPHSIALKDPAASAPVTISTDGNDARGSVLLKDGAPDWISLDLSGVQAAFVDEQTARPQQITADRLIVHFRQVETPSKEGSVGNFGQGLAIKGENVQLSENLDPPLGRSIEHVNMSGVFRDLSPTGLSGVTAERFRTWAENGGKLDLQSFDIKWRDLDIISRGTLSLDSAKRPAGTLNARIAGLPPTIDQLSAAGTLDLGAAVALKFAASAVTGPDGRLELPLGLRQGKIYIGPAPVGKLGPLY